MRLAFVNTRMPGMTFLSRDLLSLLDQGVDLDLYMLDLEGLAPELSRRLQESGGTVARVPFPWSGEIARAFLLELIRHPVTLAGSILLALWTCLRSPAEGVRALAILPSALALGRRIATSGGTQVHGLWAGVPAMMGFWVHRHFGIPYSFSGHAWDITGRTYLLSRKVREARGMVVCSEFARRTVCGRIDSSLHDRVHLVHHGLDLEEWGPADRGEGKRRDGSSQETLRILAVGRLTPKKGYSFLVEACARLRDRGLKVHCEIIGPDAGCGPELRALISQHGLSDAVHLSGEVSADEVRRRMPEADVLACPSVRTESGDSDGIPNVLLEAMALGVPVVATDAGGISEVVRPGGTGRIVPQRSAHELAEALWGVKADCESSRRMAVTARRLLEESFDRNATARGFRSAILAV